MTLIIPTTSAEHIGKRLIDKEDMEVIFLDKNKKGKRYFPDDEVYTRISKIDKLNERTVLLHSGAPKPNSGLVELEMLLETIGDSKASPIEVFFTYFPYGMQDKIFQNGETNAAENIVKRLTNYYFVERIYIIDAHFAGREWVSKYPLINTSAVSLLMERASKDYPGVIYLAPDAGSQRRTRLKGIKKKRLDSHTVEIQVNEDFGNTVKGKTVGVVDDLLQTGGTLVRFGNECKRYGAKNLIALITHGVLQSGIERVQNEYDKLYLTNTINRDEANVDITDLVSDTIKNKHLNI